MASKLYNPFVDFKFENEYCFLTGEHLQSKDEQVQVFPLWMMRQFDLEEKPFKMLDENIVTYKSLKLPCAADTAGLFETLEKEVETAMQAGYDAVNALPELRLFQWVAKILYGVVFNEIQSGVRQAFLSGEPMNFSQALVHKFRNLHYMLQSLTVPMEFEHRNPFSVLVLPVDNAPENFNYRDEINTLIFSFRMKDFAIIATLQDNGTHAIYHQEVLAAVAGKKLHAIQFEEICARYFYSAYLFNRLPEYTYMETPAKVYVEPMPLNDWTLKPIFDNWQVKTYGQVLENFWKPWGYTLFEIIKNPEKPMSFLLDETGRFREDLDLAKA
ncbi:hypothetical protein PQ465_03290 [Sphingobacterium oryzagri]|uniref:Uncharacterized protein n=1 Tax=Sphingobacterium oryzagri TaxID=3025669 RepID=A0ABY7WLV5_9SPHI|nr:hypothetical protein [Sphingobacterium sp. KACC 22765]WDF69416.1 hypothetical protein PQ465_03290 [Sphingobacterium sp. KACC 22765]